MDNWRKSSRSMANGNCVEVRPEWRKTTRSLNNPAACVEVAAVDAGVSWILP